VRALIVHAAPEIELERAQFFRVLGPDLLDQVRPLLLEGRFYRQRVLFFEGQPATHLWLVRRGEVRMYKSSRDGRITTLETLRAGEIFGPLSALDEETYPASAEGVSDGVAWRLERGVALRLIREDPRVAVEFLRIVSGRLHEAEERLRSLACDPAPTRLARALLQACRDGEARVTRRALAEAAGTTVETAIRTLRRFERDGFILGEVGHVHVLDEPGLRRIGSTGETKS
jgi:CRP/FNR family transcriptional regulator